MNRTDRFDAVVIGAGIVGAACADALSEGGLRVAIVEGDLIGGDATAAGMGHVVVMDDSEAQFALTRYSQKLWRTKQLPAALSSEYRETGTLWVAADEEEMAEVQRKLRFYRERGVPVEALDGAQLAECEPQLRPGLEGALLVPQDAVLYPPVAARSFVERTLQRPGCAFVREQAEAIEGDCVRLRDGAVLRGSYVINAAGAAAAQLTPGLPVVPRKGHLVITDRYPGFLRHQLVELGYLKSAHASDGDSVAFNAQPRLTGQILLGSSRQYGATDKKVDAAITGRMLQRAFEYMPGLRGLLAIRTWTGFRAATPDKLPLVGPWPSNSHLWLATGHEGLGITTSLGSAALLADQMLGRTPKIDPVPYLPGRYAAVEAELGCHV